MFTKKPKQNQKINQPKNNLVNNLTYSVKQSHYIRTQDHLMLVLSQVSVMAPGSSISTTQSSSHTYLLISSKWSICPSGAHIRSSDGDKSYLKPSQSQHTSINLFSVRYLTVWLLYKGKGEQLIQTVSSWRFGPGNILPVKELARRTDILILHKYSMSCNIRSQRCIAASFKEPMTRGDLKENRDLFVRCCVIFFPLILHFSHCIHQ